MSCGFGKLSDCSKSSTQHFGRDRPGMSFLRNLGKLLHEDLGRSAQGIGGICAQRGLGAGQNRIETAGDPSERGLDAAACGCTTGDLAAVDQIGDRGTADPGNFGQVLFGQAQVQSGCVDHEPQPTPGVLTQGVIPARSVRVRPVCR